MNIPPPQAKHFLYIPQALDRAHAADVNCYNNCFSSYVIAHIVSVLNVTCQALDFWNVLNKRFVLLVQHLVNSRENMRNSFHQSQYEADFPACSPLPSSFGCVYMLLAEGPFSLWFIFLPLKAICLHFHWSRVSSVRSFLCGLTITVHEKMSAMLPERPYILFFYLFSINAVKCCQTPAAPLNPQQKKSQIGQQTTRKSFCHFLFIIAHCKMVKCGYNIVLL